MARPSARLALSGHRFLLHRMERALLHSDLHTDLHTDDDSPRAQWRSLTVGAVAAVLAVALCAVLTTLRPQPQWGAADIVMVPDTGALYVRIDDVVHPVLNLTSARLVTGTAGTPRQVTDTAIVDGERGPLLGIAGAPPAIGAPLTGSELQWTVCDDEATTVIAGPLDPTAHPLGPERAVLVTGPSGTTYLLHDGRRARVDLADTGVVKALGAEGVRPAVVSTALLDILPEVAPISTPRIPGAGTPAPAALPGFVIGDVVAVRGAADTDYYVLLAGGVQRIGRVAADILRHTGAGPAVTAVAPATVDALPIIGALPVETFPDRLGAVTGAEQAVCVSWGDADIGVLAGAIPLQASQSPVGLAGADGAGPRTDAVYVPAGRSAYVSDGTRGGTGWLVTDLGFRFRVADADAARVLALPDPVAVPRAVLEALPRGPELSRTAALTAYVAP